MKHQAKILPVWGFQPWAPDRQSSEPATTPSSTPIAFVTGVRWSSLGRQIFARVHNKVVAEHYKNTHAFTSVLERCSNKILCKRKFWVLEQVYHGGCRLSRKSQTEFLFWNPTSQLTKLCEISHTLYIIIWPCFKTCFLYMQVNLGIISPTALYTSYKNMYLNQGRIQGALPGSNPLKWICFCYKRLKD